MLSSPVIFELGRHDPGSLHANVDALQAEGEGVCELHSRHHLFIHFSAFRHLKYTKNILKKSTFLEGNCVCWFIKGFKVKFLDLLAT